MFCPLYTYCYCDHTAPHSSPTRRSSDLTKDELASFGDPDFVIINAGAFPANKLTTGMGSTTSIDLSIEDKQLIILGTEYAGEMKKGVFTVANYFGPKQIGRASCRERV